MPLRKPHPMLLTATLLTLLAGAILGYSYLTVDDGPLATTKGGVIPRVDNLTALAADPARPGHVYLATSDGVAHGPLSGRWYTTIEHERPHATALAVRADGAHFWFSGFPRKSGLVTFPFGVHAAHLDAEHSEALGLAGTAFSELEASLVAPGTVWAYEPEEGSLRVSRDDGKTWTLLPEALPGIRDFAAAPDGTLYAAGSTVLASRDDGASWTPWLQEDVHAIAAHPSDNLTLLVANANGMVLRTLDGGATWTPLDLEPAEGPIRELAVGPDGTLYAATRVGGVYASTDGGDAWAMLREA